VPANLAGRKGVVTLQLNVILAPFTLSTALNDDIHPVPNTKYAAIVKFELVELRSAKHQ